MTEQICKIEILQLLYQTAFLIPLSHNLPVYSKPNIKPKPLNSTQFAELSSSVCKQSIKYAMQGKFGSKHDINVIYHSMILKACDRRIISALRTNSVSM